MDNKIGIRLRHLQKNTNNYQPNNEVVFAPNSINYNKVQNKLENDKPKKNRSISPSGRRKIFDRDQNMTKNSEKSRNTYYQPEYEAEKKFPQIQSMQFLKKLSNNSDFDKDFQIERLISSLKAKSLDLEKKDEIIKRLRKEIQTLKVQNREYRKQISDLREQYGQKINNTRQIVCNSRQNYSHEPYEEFQIHSTATNGFEKKKMNHKIQNIIEEKQRQQNIILSPLMALNSGQSHSGKNKIEKYNQPFQSFNATNTIQIPKNVYERNHEAVKYNKMKDSIESKNDYRGQVMQQNQIYHNPFLKNMPPFASSSGHSNIGSVNSKEQIKSDPSFLKEDYFPFFMEKSNKTEQNINNLSNRKKEMYKQEKKISKNLQIEDSKQFQFEDFDIGDSQDHDQIF